LPIGTGDWLAFETRGQVRSNPSSPETLTHYFQPPELSLFYSLIVYWKMIDFQGECPLP